MLRYIIPVGICYVLLVGDACASLRVATYNLDNYLVMDRYLEDQWRPEYPKPEKEKATVREIIRQADPDILALQEVGEIQFLEELRADLTLEGLNYEYAAHLDGPDPERHIAILSKVAPVEVVQHTNLDFKYFDQRKRVKRGMLEVSFQTEKGEAFKLFIVHLKSKYTNDKTDPNSSLRRTREAEACRNRIIERTFDIGADRFLVAGDFNDHPVSAPLRRFYSRGDLEIGRLVPAADSRGEVWTYFYDKQAQYSLVDGFVASPEMLPIIVGGQGQIVDAPGALDGSDHRMVYLDLVGGLGSQERELNR